MHAALETRLRWLTQEYIPGLFDSRETIRMLDMGRYETHTRSAFFADPRIEYATLEADADSFTEYIMKHPYQWPMWESGNFDIVVATHALEHIEEPWRTIREAARVLRPGGYLCLIEPGLTETIWNVRSTVLIPSFTRHKNLLDHFRFGSDTLRGMVERAGLHVEYSGMNEGPGEAGAEWFSRSETMLIAVKEEPTKKTCARLPLFSRPRPERFSPALIKGEQSQAAKTQPGPRKRRKICTVIGTCHAENIGIMLNNAQDDYEIHLVFANKFPKPDSDECYYQVDAKEYENSDLLFISDEPEMRKAVRHQGKTIVYPTLRFAGFYPDFSAPIDTAILQQGSSIVAECYLRGIEEKYVPECFTHATYKRLGYFDIWDLEVAAMRKRFAALELDFDMLLARWMRQGVFMNDSVHPKDFVTKDIVSILCERHGFPIRKHLQHIAFDWSWRDRVPVYPEIADRLNMPHVGSYSFRVTQPLSPPPYRWEETLNLAEYIAYSYNGYRADPMMLHKFKRLRHL